MRYPKVIHGPLPSEYTVKTRKFKCESSSDVLAGNNGEGLVALLREPIEWEVWVDYCTRMGGEPYYGVEGKQECYAHYNHSAGLMNGVFARVWVSNRVKRPKTPSG
jgi:hypothetical protein